MNEIEVLNSKIYAMDIRASEISKVEGKKKVKAELVQLFAVLNAAGYKAPEGDAKLMADVWYRTLAPYIVTYGYDIIPASAWEFISQDSREVKTFPKPSDYINAIKQIGGMNPKVELARLKAKQVEDEIERQHREEYAKLWEELPEDKKREMEGVNYASNWKNENL